MNPAELLGVSPACVASSYANKRQVTACRQKTSISKNEAAMGAEQKVDRQGEIRQDGGLDFVTCRSFRPRSPILRNQGGYKIQA